MNEKQKQSYMRLSNRIWAKKKLIQGHYQAVAHGHNEAKHHAMIDVLVRDINRLDSVRKEYIAHV